MVTFVRRGNSMRAAANKFKVSLSVVQRWVRKAEGKRLDRVDWSDGRGGRRERISTPCRIEDLVIEARQRLKLSDLGEFGAAAIQQELAAAGERAPSLRTIGRILARRGALDGNRRVRRKAPPKGWHLPEVVAGRAELDSFDFVEGLVIKGGTDVKVLNAISLHGGLCASWVATSWTAVQTVEALIEHWRQNGLPAYAQFDNDTIFQGAHQWKDSFGRVIRLCLQLGVVPVFAPPRETGFQAQIESYNGRWQSKVWQRFEHGSLNELADRSERYVQAVNCKGKARRDGAPSRRPFPKDWQLDLTRPLSGLVVFVRRTDEQGRVSVLGHTLPVDPKWPHRLVRADVDLNGEQIRLYRLRRSEPNQQPLIRQLKYDPPTKPFQG